MYGGQGKMFPSNSKIKLRKKDNPGALWTRSNGPFLCFWLPWVFMQRRDESPWEAYELLQRLSEDVKNRDLGSIREQMELIRPLLEWRTLDQFDRRKVNRCLKQYALGDEEWMWE